MAHSFRALIRDLIIVRAHGPRVERRTALAWFEHENPCQNKGTLGRRQIRASLFLSFPEH